MKTFYLFTMLFCAWTPSLFAQVNVSTITDEFDASGGVKIGPDGCIYVANFGDGLSNANGTQVWKLDEDFNLSIFATGLSGASGNDFDSQGNLFQSNIAANRISKITPDGTVSTFANLGQGASPVGIAIDEEDNLYICQCGNATIRKITPTGQLSIFASGPLFNCPNGAVFDHEGNLYISNFSNGSVIKITPAGVPSFFVNIPGSNNGHLAFSSIDTVLYVNSHGSSRIYRVTLDGASEIVAGSGVRGNADGPAESATFSRPNGIEATDSGDTLFLNTSIPLVDNPGNNFFPLNPSILRMITGLKEDPNAAFEPWKFEGLELNNYPNPADAQTILTYKLPLDLEVSILLRDANGKLLKTFEQGFQQEGKYNLELLTNDLSPGIYEYALVGKEFMVSRKLLIQR